MDRQPLIVEHPRLAALGMVVHDEVAGVILELGYDGVAGPAQTAAVMATLQRLGLRPVHGFAEAFAPAFGRSYDLFPGQRQAPRVPSLVSGLWRSIAHPGDVWVLTR